MWSAGQIRESGYKRGSMGCFKLKNGIYLRVTKQKNCLCLQDQIVMMLACLIVANNPKVIWPNGTLRYMVYTAWRMSSKHLLSAERERERDHFYPVQRSTIHFKPNGNREPIWNMEQRNTYFRKTLLVTPLTESKPTQTNPLGANRLSDMNEISDTYGHRSSTDATSIS